MKKRSLSFFLAVLMVVSVLPLSTWAAETANDDGTSLLAETDVLADAIYLPVTVRDFKSDGILFEYNNNNNSAASASSIATNYAPAITPSTGNQLEKGANSATGGFGQAYVSKRLSGISASDTDVSYQVNGSMILTADDNNNDGVIDPQLNFTLDSFTYRSDYAHSAYRFLAMVYKNPDTEMINSSYNIFWGASTNDYGSNTITKKYSATAGSTLSSTTGASGWNVAFIEIPFTNKQVINKLRFDWTTDANAKVTVAGIYLVNPPKQLNKQEIVAKNSTDKTYDVSTVTVHTDNPASYFGVDSNGMLYARITAAAAQPFGIRVGTNQEDRNQKTTYGGDQNAVVAIRYKTTASVTMCMIRGSDGFGTYQAQDLFSNGNLITDGKWHWLLGRFAGYTAGTDINNFGLYFRGGAQGDTIDIAEVILLTEAEVNNFRAYERVSGNGSVELANANDYDEGFKTVTTSNGTTDTVVTKTECQDVLARPFYDGKIKNHYTKYIAQKANAVVNLYDYTYVENASSSRLDFGANGKKIRYVQIRYRASNFPATNSSGTYIQNKLTFQFYTVSGDTATPPINNQAERSVRIDADGTWHTLVIDLGTNFEWYLFDIYTKLPNGAVLDVDYITFFHPDATANSINSSGILGAEYWNVNRSNSSNPGDYINKYTNGYNFIHEAFTMVQFTAINGTVPRSVIDGRAYEYIWSDIAASKGTKAAEIQAGLGEATVGISYLTGTQNIYGGNFNTHIKNGSTYEAGGWHIGLVEPELVNGKIRYKEVTVRFIARVLSLALMIPYENADGSRNYSALAGDKIDMKDLQYYDLEATNGDTCFDLAQYLRYKIKRYNDSTTDAFIVGGYDETLEKVQDEGDITLKNIRTCTDAAYYLLNNMWNSYEDNGYGRNTYQYSNIGLIPFKTSSGVDAYMFGSSYTNTVYSDIQKDGLGIIYNTQTKNEVWMAVNPDPNNIAGTTSANRFLTNFISGYGTTHSPYYISLGNLANNKNDYYSFTTKDAAGKEFKNWYKVSNWDTLAGVTSDKANAHFYDQFYKSGVNYNSTIEGKGQFTYKKSENLFFTFLGDDDVYLFINNKLALDLGGAHVRSGYTINLNSMAEDLGLVDGETYDFSFFQAERHGFGSNFQILTNIKIVNPDIEVEKTASQSGKNLQYGAQVSETEPVDYNFMLENTKKSDKTLVHLSFDDPAIGIHLGYDTLSWNTHANINNITVKTYDAILDSEGEPTGNYNVYTYQANSDDPGVLDLDEAKLKEILTGKLFPDQVADTVNYGMSYGDKIEIIGIKHVLTEAQVQQGAFRNTVTVVANVITPVGTYEPLVKNDTFLVIVANDKIYLWAGHERSFTMNQLFADGEYLGTYPFSYYSSGTATVEDEKYTFTATAAYIANSATDTGATVTLASGSKISAYKFTVSFPNVGMYMFDYNITTTVKDSGGTVKENTTYKYSVAVYVYDVEDVHFEIDYGLPVALSTSGDGKIVGNVCADDTLALDENGSTTWKTFGYCDSEGEVSGLNATSGSNGQGDFSAISGDAATGYNFTYTPNKFIEKADEVYLKFGVSEDHSSTEPKPYTVTMGIVMWKKISMRPASVMYYEEYIDSIKTNDTYGVTYYGNGIALNDGKPVAKYCQSADQSLQYGYDPAYNEDLKTNNDAIPAEYYSKWFKKLYTLEGTGTGGFDGKGNNYAFSNNSVLFLNVGGSKDDANSYYSSYMGKEGTDRSVVNFTFSGTGFELISYTNLYTATFMVEVYNSSDELVQRKTVMTKYTNGQLHQIPVIDFETPTYGTYTVHVYAIPSASGASPLFYLDGIRIFNPMDPSASLPNAEVGDYLATERYTSFNEIRNNILDDKIIISKVEVDAKGNVIAKAGTNSALVEHVGKGLGGLYDAPVGTKSDESALTYASVGPNNEIYLDKNSAITFLLKEATLTSNNAYPASRTFQIEAKMLGENSTGTLLTYATTDGAAVAPVLSYTAMYFPISVTECPAVTVNDSTYYVVTIGCADDVKNNYVDGVISLTSFKMNGYELCTNLSTLITTEETANAATTEVTRTVYENMIDISAYALAYNGDLFVKTVTASPSAIAGETIKLNIVASANADRVFVKDASGEFVESTVQSVKTLGEYKIFTVTINAPEEAGTYQYAVTVQDGDNRLSEEMRTAAIKVN